MILEGYIFNSNGKEYNLAAYKDFEELENSYQNDYTVYFLTDERVFVLGGYVIAEGDLSGLTDVEPPMRVSAYKRKSIERKVKMLNDIREAAMGYEPKPQIDMSNRRKYTYEEKIEERPIEEIKKENPEWFTETELCEVSIPTMEELDNYFSSIGFNLPEAN